MHKKIICIILTSMLLYLPGCGGGSAIRSFVRENVSVVLIKNIAVLPFEGAEYAPRVREITMTQILASGVFDVVDKGRVDSVLAQEALAPGAPIDSATIKRLGQVLNVQAFILGSVTQTTETRGAAGFVELTMTMRLLDAETGMIIWQASGRGSGYSLMDRLFGLAPKDTFAVTLKLLDDLFKTMI